MFKWSSEEKLVFDTLRDQITSAPILALPDNSRPYRVEADSSDFATSAVLSQQNLEDHKWYPIAFLFKSLSLLGDRFPSLSASTVSLVYSDCYLYPTQFISTTHYFLHLHVAHACCPHPSLVAVAAPHSSRTFTQVLLDYSVSHVPP